MSFTKLFGWGGPAKAEEQWRSMRHLFSPFQISGYTAGEEIKDGSYMLWRIARQLLGKDCENYPQQTGDCVSFGAANAIKHLQCAEIAAGDQEEYHPIFPPYLYGTGRVFVGKGQLGREQGSFGSWQAEAVRKYGVLRSNFAGVPKYTKSIAEKWGANPGPPTTFVDEAKQHLVGSTARLTTLQQAVTSLAIAAAPFTIASEQGFNMTPDANGIHRPGREPWPHQMAVIGVEVLGGSYTFCVINSWGDVHGKLVDKVKKDQWPAGCLRVAGTDIQRMIKSGEAFAFGGLQGFRRNDKVFDWRAIV